MLTVNQAIALLEGLGLQIRYSKQEYITLIGGINIDIVVVGKAIGWDISEPAFFIREGANHWNVKVDDMDSELESYVTQDVETLQEAVELVITLFAKIPNQS
jgi:hypothetical protein